MNKCLIINFNINTGYNKILSMKKYNKWYYRNNKNKNNNNKCQMK